MKLFFSNKGNLGQNIKLVEENELPQNDKEIADEVNSFFKSTIPSLEKKNYNMFYHKSDFPNLKQRSSKVAWVHMPALQLGRISFCFVKRSHYYHYY